MRKNILILTTLIAFATTTMVSCKGGDKKAEVKTDVYECPMKCNNGQTYDKPGNCPVCGMELEKVIKT